LIVIAITLDLLANISAQHPDLEVRHHVDPRTVMYCGFTNPATEACVLRLISRLRPRLL
jgi:hypothetical protein